MKRSTLLKAVFSLAMVFAFTGMFAQYGGMTLKIDGVTDYVTVSSSLPYVVEADPIFSPGWAGSFSEDQAYDKQALTTQEWTWNFGASGIAFNAASTVATSNYVLLDMPAAPATGLSITVKESNPLSGCAGSDKTINFVVCGTPEVAINATTATAAGNKCGAIAAQDISFDVTETNVLGASYGKYYFEVTKKVETVDGGGNATAVYTNTSTLIANTTAVDLTGATWSSSKATHTVSEALAFHNDGTDDHPTRYTYTLTATGIQSQISRKSDYNAVFGNAAPAFADYTAYDKTAESVVFTVFPTPVTGPIYTAPL